MSTVLVDNVTAYGAYGRLFQVEGRVLRVFSKQSSSGLFFCAGKCAKVVRVRGVCCIADLLRQNSEQYFRGCADTSVRKLRHDLGPTAYD